MTTITLWSNDGKAITVDVKIAEMSGMIKGMLENTTMLETGEQMTIPDVNGETLEKVFEWAEHHVNDPPEIIYDDYFNIYADLRPCDALFFEVISYSNFLVFVKFPFISSVKI